MEGAKDDLPRPVVTFFPPHSTQELVLFSLFEGDESSLQKFLPKSHLTNVIIHDNISVQRVQEIKIKDLDNSQRKTGNHYEHMKKRFLHDQRSKMNRWKQQYSRYQRMLEKIDQRAMRQATLMYPGQYSLQLQMALLKNR